jgi:hypothetical protein
MRSKDEDFCGIASGAIGKTVLARSALVLRTAELDFDIDVIVVESDAADGDADCNNVEDVEDPGTDDDSCAKSGDCRVRNSRVGADDGADAEDNDEDDNENDDDDDENEDDDDDDDDDDDAGARRCVICQLSGGGTVRPTAQTLSRGYLIPWERKNRCRREISGAGTPGDSSVANALNPVKQRSSAHQHVRSAWGVRRSRAPSAIIMLVSGAWRECHLSIELSAIKPRDLA